MVETPPGELIDDREHAERLAVMGAVLDEIIGPDMFGVLRPKTDARLVIEPQPAQLRLLLGNL